MILISPGFIKWVQAEIENYASIIRRQVFDSKQDFATIAECLGHTMRHCHLLKESGLDLSFVLDKLFYQDLIEAIDKHARKCEESVVKALTKDSFVAISSSILKDDVRDEWDKDFGMLIISSDNILISRRREAAFEPERVRFLHCAQGLCEKHQVSHIHPCNYH